METETIFRIILPILIISFAAHRGYYVKYHSKPEDATVKQREEGIVSKLAGLLGMAGFISMIVYVINPNWLAFGSLAFPTWLRWAGVGIAIAGICLASMGTSDPCQQLERYTAHDEGTNPHHQRTLSLHQTSHLHGFLLILGSTLLISSNWLIGLCWAGMTILEIISRIGFEESLMLEYFGDQYREYMKKTGRIFPKLI